MIALPKSAHADGPELVLHWSGPTGCDDGEVARKRALSLMGPGARVEADAVVTEVSGRLRVVLRVRSGHSAGERVLDEDSCEPLIESTAVILALSGSAALVEAPPPPPPMPAPAVVLLPAPVPASVAPKAVHDIPPSKRLWRVRVAPLASFDVGTLPNPTLGGGLLVALAAGHGVALGLSGTAWLERHADSPFITPAQGADFTLLTADATGCYALLRGSLELSPCAVVELGHISATGSTATRPQDTSATWIAVGLGVRGRWELTRAFGLVAEVDGLVPTQSPSFSIQSGTAQEAIYSVGSVVLRAYLGPELRF